MEIDEAPAHNVLQTLWVQDDEVRGCKDCKVRARAPGGGAKRDVEERTAKEPKGTNAPAVAVALKAVALRAAAALKRTAGDATPECARRACAQRASAQRARTATAGLRTRRPRK